MRRGFDLSFTFASQLLRLPNGKEFIFNFLFGKTLRAGSREAVVVLADEGAETCAYRAVSEYIEAAKAIGWDLSAGYLFPTVKDDGARGTRKYLARAMTVSLQGHLRAADLPPHFTMHSFRVGGSLSRSMDGTAIEEIMRIGGWKTELMARHYIGPTTSGGSEDPRAKKKQRARTYVEADQRPLSLDFQRDFAAC